MNVNLYSTPTCYYCKVAKDYLRKKGIKFKEFNVAVDKRRAEEMVRKTGQMGVPVIVINNKMIVGFDKNKLDRMF